MPKINEKYVYLGNEYVVTNLTKFKHPDTREWIEAVQYRDEYGESFTREADEFQDRFELVPERQVQLKLFA